MSLEETAHGSFHRVPRVPTKQLYSWEKTMEASNVLDHLGAALVSGGVEAVSYTHLTLPTTD